MKIKQAIDKIISHNAIVALWVPTGEGYSVLFWRGMAHEIPKEYESFRIDKIFGTVPVALHLADTINIRVKHKPIEIGCRTCVHKGRMSCPNSFECWAKEDKPHWKLKRSEVLRK